MEDVRKTLKLRHKMGSIVPGTRTYHCFTPISTHEIQLKRINADAEFSGSFKFIASPTEGIESKISEVKIIDFVACYYDMRYALVDWIVRKHQQRKDRLQDKVYAPTRSSCKFLLASNG